LPCPLSLYCACSAGPAQSASIPASAKVIIAFRIVFSIISWNPVLARFRWLTAKDGPEAAQDAAPNAILRHFSFTYSPCDFHAGWRFLERNAT
jgi:hypothetical protein